MCTPPCSSFLPSHKLPFLLFWWHTQASAIWLLIPPLRSPTPGEREGPLPSQATFYLPVLHTKIFLLQVSSWRNTLLYVIWELQACTTWWQFDQSHRLQLWLREPAQVVAISAWVKTFCCVSSMGSTDATLLRTSFPVNKCTLADNWLPLRNS